MNPFITLYKDGEERKVFHVDAGAYLANGWTTQPQPVVAAPLPVVAATPEAEIEQPTLETPVELPAEAAVVAPKPEPTKPKAKK